MLLLSWIVCELTELMPAPDGTMPELWMTVGRHCLAAGRTHRSGGSGGGGAAALLAPMIAPAGLRAASCRCLDHSCAALLAGKMACALQSPTTAARASRRPSLATRAAGDRVAPQQQQQQRQQPAPIQRRGALAAAAAAALGLLPRRAAADEAAAPPAIDIVSDEPGSGTATARRGDLVLVHYRGTVDGAVFDSTLGGQVRARGLGRWLFVQLMLQSLPPLHPAARHPPHSPSQMYRDGGKGVLRPAAIALGGGPVPGVCAGLLQGIEGMRVGGRRTVTVPPALGFGGEPVLAPYGEPRLWWGLLGPGRQAGGREGCCAARPPAA